MPLEINDSINIQDRINGVIRYVGPIEGKSGEWVGIELDAPVGPNDGRANGKRYFSCEPRHGIFVRKIKLAQTIVELNKKNEIQSKSTNELSNVPYSNVNESFLSSKIDFNRLENQNFLTNSSSLFEQELLGDSKPTYKAYDKYTDYTKQKDYASDKDYFYHKDNIKIGCLENGKTCGQECKNLIKANEELRNEVNGYKKLCKELVEKSKVVLDMVYSNLNCLLAKINKLKSNRNLYAMTDKERQSVVNLVTEIVNSVENKDKDKTSDLYEKFTKTMKNYNITV
jgi:dynactin complex subunit